MNSKENRSDTQIKRTVMLSDICSAEHYLKSGVYERILSDITFDVLSGESVGIAAQEMNEAKLLMEIIANVRPYYSGKCVLDEKGMMQKKRLILPHLFYIDTPNMLYNNMTVLEFLMFASEHAKQSHVHRQRKFLDMLIELGMDSIALSQISSLTDSDKMIIELIIAAQSSSTLIIFNALDYSFTYSQARTIKKICSIIKTKGSIIIGTNEPKLIGICCDKVAYILEGKIRFFGTVEDLCNQWDKVLYLITANHPVEIAVLLRKVCKKYTYVTNGNSVLVYNYTDTRLKHSEFLGILFDNGISPDNIKLNKGRVENSFEELIRHNDL
jgi:ABC-2 type transport system ATP-binding protein